jgi:hypothetical protein
MMGDGIGMDLRETGLGGCRVDSVCSGEGPVADSCEHGDDLSGSGST